MQRRLLQHANDQLVRKWHRDQAVPALRDPLRERQVHPADHRGGAAGHGGVHVQGRDRRGPSCQLYYTICARSVSYSMFPFGIRFFF